MSIYDEKYIKARVREFNGAIKTNFLANKIPKENEHYTCIASITIDYFMRIEKKNYLHVHLEKFNFRMKEAKWSNLVRVRIESELESDIRLELMSDT